MNKFYNILGWLIILNIFPVTAGMITLTSGRNYWEGFSQVWLVFGISGLVMGLVFLAFKLIQK